MEEYQHWPSRLTAPKVLDVLGTSVVLRCAKVPNAKYTFQLAKGGTAELRWDDSLAGSQSNECKPKVCTAKVVLSPKHSESAGVHEGQPTFDSTSPLPHRQS